MEKGRYKVVNTLNISTRRVSYWPQIKNAFQALVDPGTFVVLERRTMWSNHFWNNERESTICVASDWYSGIPGFVLGMSICICRCRWYVSISVASKVKCMMLFHHLMPKCLIKASCASCVCCRHSILVLLSFACQSGNTAVRITW